MKHLLTATAAAVTLAGIWQHDWRTILAGAAVAAIWPLIRDDVTHVCTCAKGRRCLNCVERDGLTRRNA